MIEKLACWKQKADDWRTFSTVHKSTHWFNYTFCRARRISQLPPCRFSRKKVHSLPPNMTWALLSFARKAQAKINSEMRAFSKQQMISSRRKLTIFLVNLERWQKVCNHCTLHFNGEKNVNTNNIFNNTPGNVFRAERLMGSG